MKSAAALAVEQGLKAPSKIVTIVEDATRLACEIHEFVTDIVENVGYLECYNSQDQDQALLRERYGLAIRRWKPEWRLHVMYAFFVHIFESDSSSRSKLCIDHFSD